MCLAFRFSEELGLCPAGTASACQRRISTPSACPTRINDIPGGKADAGELVRLMGQDKKVRDGQLTFILVRGIGEAFVSRDVRAGQGPRLPRARDRGG